jgi:hypothetical protein
MFHTININFGYNSFSQLLPNDLFKSCSSEELMIKSHPRYFVYFLGRIQFGSLAIMTRVR